MPVISTSSGFLIFTAFAPVLAAAASAATPEQIDAYTLIGACMAVFLSMTYLWVRAPRLVKPANIAFTFFASLTVGALLPEPLVWGLVRFGWLDVSTVEIFPRKLWGLIALACGLSGTTLVLVAIHWAQSRLPKLIFQEEQDEVARIKLENGSDINVRSIADHSGPPKTP